jgi:tRNA 2-selenouridine synthase
LVSEYTQCNNELLINSIMRISKRLGGQHVIEALQQLEINNYFEVAMIALNYYDKSYQKGVNHREAQTIYRIELPNTDHLNNAKIIEKYIIEHE